MKMIVKKCSSRIIISLYHYFSLVIHCRDERYYPNPEEFRPERFMGEELQNRHKGTYMAFGEGKSDIAVLSFRRQFHVKIPLF